MKGKKSTIYFKKRIILIFTIILLILQIFIIHPSFGQCDNEKNNSDEVSSEVQLYEHFEGFYGLNNLLSYPLQEEQQQNASGKLYFKVPTYDNNYDLKIKANSIVHFEQWFSSSRTMFVELGFILSDDNVTEIFNVKNSYRIGTSPTKCILDQTIQDQDLIINKTHSLYIIIEIFIRPAFSGTILTTYSGPQYPSGITIEILDPILVELRITDNPDDKKLHIYSLITTPFEGENIDEYRIVITGPTNQDDLFIMIACYPASMGSRDWWWCYGKSDPKPGKYNIYLTATTRQGVSGEDQYEFILKDNDNNRDNDDQFYYNYNLIILMSLIFFIVIITLIYTIKKKIGFKK